MGLASSCPALFFPFLNLFPVNSPDTFPADLDSTVGGIEVGAGTGLFPCLRGITRVGLR